MSRRKDNPSRWRVWPKEKKTRKPADKRDTEELVRCKECCHLEITGCYGECGRGYLGIVRPDDYCSRGRRREKKHLTIQRAAAVAPVIGAVLPVEKTPVPA